MGEENKAEWKRVNGGKYLIELDGWHFVVERVDIRDNLCYKFQLYENMDRPQSASALEVRINGGMLSAHTKGNHTGALQHITDYFEKENVFQYKGIPEPLKSNLMNALEQARINLNL